MHHERSTSKEVYNVQNGVEATYVTVMSSPGLHWSTRSSSSRTDMARGM